MATETYLISKYEEDDLPDLDFKKFGRDGNIFAIVGTVTKALRISDLPDKDELITEVQQRVTSSHSYSDALSIAQEYVNLIVKKTIKSPLPAHNFASSLSLNG